MCQDLEAKHRVYFFFIDIFMAFIAIFLIDMRIFLAIFSVVVFEYIV